MAFGDADFDGRNEIGGSFDEDAIIVVGVIEILFRRGRFFRLLFSRNHAALRIQVFRGEIVVSIGLTAGIQRTIVLQGSITRLIERRNH